jgi:hypothetical protein
VRLRALLLVAAAVALAGCGIANWFGPTGGVYPGACEELGFKARQCAAIVDRAAQDAGIKADAVASIDILPPASDASVTLGGRMIARVRFHPTSGATRIQEVWCIGVGSPDSLVCEADPQIRISARIDHDVPCDAGVCATLPPTPRPASVAKARALHVATLDIPVDHVGHYEIDAGPAGLPDGALSERSATLADTRPQDFWTQGDIKLEVRPVLAGRPPVGSVYRDPFDGVEPVEAFLVFDVYETSPGAVLQVRDIVVR